MPPPCPGQRGGHAAPWCSPPLPRPGPAASSPAGSWGRTRGLWSAFQVTFLISRLPQMWGRMSWSRPPAVVCLRQCPAQKQASHPKQMEAQQTFSFTFSGTKNAITFSLVTEELIKSLIRDGASQRLRGRNSRPGCRGVSRRESPAGCLGSISLPPASPHIAWLDTPRLPLDVWTTRG